MPDTTSSMYNEITHQTKIKPKTRRSSTAGDFNIHKNKRNFHKILQKKQNYKLKISSKQKSSAFSVHNRRTRLIILFLLNPHLFKRRQRQDRTSNPHRILSLWRCNPM